MVILQSSFFPSLHDCATNSPLTTLHHCFIKHKQTGELSQPRPWPNERLSMGRRSVLMCCSGYWSLALAFVGRHNNNIVMYSRVWIFPTTHIAKYSDQRRSDKGVGPIFLRHGGCPVRRLTQFFVAPTKITQFKASVVARKDTDRLFHSFSTTPAKNVFFSRTGDNFYAEAPPQEGRSVCRDLWRKHFGGKNDSSIFFLLRRNFSAGPKLLSAENTFPQRFVEVLPT